jgi:hypothetical protein
MTSDPGPAVCLAGGGEDAQLVQASVTSGIDDRFTPIRSWFPLAAEIRLASRRLMYQSASQQRRYRQSG